MSKLINKYNVCIKFNAMLSYSNSSWTAEWVENVLINLIEIFRKKFIRVDIITASPLLAQSVEKNIDLKEIRLYKIWRSLWSPKYCVVLPEKVNMYTKILLTKLFIKSKSYLNKPYSLTRQKIIVHYVQPHAPYLILPQLCKLFDEFLHFRQSIPKERYILKYILDRLSYEDVALTYVKNKRILKYLYKQNYKKALKAILSLIAFISKNINKYHDFIIMITADHGELLGEYGLYFHPNIKLYPLRIVPVLVIKIKKNR